MSRVAMTSSFQDRFDDDDRICDRPDQFLFGMQYNAFPDVTSLRESDFARYVPSHQTRPAIEIAPMLITSEVAMIIVVVLFTRFHPFFESSELGPFANNTG